MRSLALVLVFALVVAIPTVGVAEKPLPPGLPLPPLPPGAGDARQPRGDDGYKAPKADGAVVELLDEGVDSIAAPVFTNDNNGEPGTVAREDRDVFAGVEAARVSPQQKYRSNIPGWSYKIVEKPKNAGEFRYLRFAWKKSGGNGMMIQFHDPSVSWGFRYHAGTNIYGWNPSTQVSARPPKGWEVVTRDLFKDYGAFTITGMALSPLDGTAGWFDHMLLGRTVEDLDKATEAALGKAKPEKALAGKERDALWTDLMGTDRVKAAAAQRLFLASASDQVGFIRDQLGKTAIDKDLHSRIQKLIKELDADDFDVRDHATEALIKLGDSAADAVQALVANPPNDEVSYRAKLIMQKLKAPGKDVSTVGRTVRAVRVLERAANADARAVLQKIADGEYGFEIAPDAKAALARLTPMPK